MALNKASSGGSFFKPADNLDARVLVIFPKGIRKDVPNEYEGKHTVRDEASVDLAVFKSAADVAEKVPAEFLTDVTVVHKALTGQVERWLANGEDGLARVGKPAGKNYYAFLTDIDDDAEAAALAWYEDRAARLAAVPSFED